MKWSCKQAKSVLVPSGPDAKRHLFALLLDPVLVEGRGSQPQVLMVCVVSIKDGLLVDESCLLDVGDHPFIAHPSFVDYRFTRLEAASHVEQLVHKGVFTPKEDCSEVLLKKIVSGALRSPRISREYKKLLESVLFR